MTAIQKAIRDLETQKKSIETAIRTLRSLGGGAASGAAGRHISPEGRRRIVEAQRRRWAKVHAAMSKSKSK